MKKIAVIGAGVAGLTLAYRMLKNGYSVKIYERGTGVGGQLHTIPIEGVSTEVYYHHTFLSDKNFVELCLELGVEKQLKYYKSSMAYYTNKKTYPFGSPIDLLRFSPLNFINKIKFVASIFSLQKVSHIKDVQEFSAKEWFELNSYGEVWRIIWEPLFKLKFSNLSDSVSLVWLWDKLLKRGKSRSGTKERLCYMENSFHSLAESLRGKIEEMGGEFFLNTTVDKITKVRNQFVISAKNTEMEVDFVLSTLTSTQNKILYDFSSNYVNYLESYKYQAAICAIFELSSSFSKYYWTNIGDYDLPFGGVIEHTRLVGADRYNGKTILYVSRYLDDRSDFFNLKDCEIIEEFILGLKEMNPKFNESQILKSHLFKQKDAQPIVLKGYKKPMVETEIENLFWISTHHVYPHDRGIEYAIEEAEKLSTSIIRSDNNS
jgi:protoporphyrinogen oxidase